MRTPFIRLLSVRLLHAPVISLTAHFHFTDTTNAYRAYSRNYLTHPKVLPLRDIFMTYELLAYLSVRATQLGLRACEIPVDRVYPKSGKTPTKISFVKGTYEPDKYLETVRGFEMCKEGGSRCGRCFELRLHETARLAKEYGMDYFTTTLTISPLKNAQRINEIGNLIAEEQKIPFLLSDFKKNNGYLRSIELSKEYGLYRQDYCGCEFSKR